MNASQPLFAVSTPRARRSLGAWVVVLLGGLFASATSAATLSPIMGVQQLALGDGHACVLTNGGGVKCWGNNEYGQLGDGSTTHRYLPVEVSGLSSGVAEVRTGYRHSCARMNDGTVKCWGKNLLLQLGDGTNTPRSTPVTVSGLSGATAIAVGGDHSCALIGLTGMKCWGYNGYGQLGIGNTDNQSTPASVVGGQNLIAITAGYSNTCAITSSNTVKCWGVRDRVCSTFGCGFDYVISPQTISGLSSVTAISAGQYFNCALVSGGAAKCWGDNYDGVLGDLSGSETDPKNPDPLQIFDISGLGSGVTSISAGYHHACVRLSDNSVRCWGDGNSGQLGDGGSADSFVPVTVSGLVAATTAAAGGRFSCARMADSGVQCWGSNGTGQLGDNDPWFRNTPVDVPGLGSGVKSISAGEFHSCAVTAGGAVKCWGDNSSGQLGDGSLSERTTPTSVSSIANGATTVSAGIAQTCAVVSGGARCWGSNASGQLGDGGYDDSPTPVSVSGLASGVSSIDTGGDHSCARLSNGSVRCWGRGWDGQLGNGPFASSATPVVVANLANSATAVTTGNAHSCAAVNGQVACWGDNSDARLGDGGYDDSSLPVFLPHPPQGTTQVTAGRAHSCAIAAGRALCWGANGDGQIGFGFTSGDVSTPATVPGMDSGMIAVSAGDSHTCSVGPGGKAWCWGNNVLGQLGDGSATRRTSPTAVIGLESGVKAISAGSYHSCALTNAGAVKCWGYNADGQLGIGRRNFRLPGPVLDDPAFFRDGFE